MEPQGPFHEVNDSIRQLATAGPVVETWDFFCECTDLGCRTLISLTLREFDDRRTASPPVPVLAPHHDAAAA